MQNCRRLRAYLNQWRETLKVTNLPAKTLLISKKSSKIYVAFLDNLLWCGQKPLKPPNLYSNRVRIFAGEGIKFRCPSPPFNYSCGATIYSHSYASVPDAGVPNGAISRGAVGVAINTRKSELEIALAVSIK